MTISPSANNSCDIGYFVSLMTFQCSLLFYCHQHHQQQQRHDHNETLISAQQYVECCFDHSNHNFVNS